MPYTALFFNCTSQDFLTTVNEHDDNPKSKSTIKQDETCHHPAKSLLSQTKKDREATPFPTSSQPITTSNPFIRPRNLDPSFASVDDTGNNQKLYQKNNSDHYPCANTLKN